MKENCTMCDSKSLVFNEISFSSIKIFWFYRCLKSIISFMDDHCDYSPKGPENVTMAQATSKNEYFCFSAAS